MEFSLDDDQQLLETTARSVARARAAELPRLLPEHLSSTEPSADRRQAIDDCWTELAQLGLTALLVPEAAGGAGGTLLDAVIVTEALAYELVPVPYAGNAIVAAALLTHTNVRERDQLDRLVAGGRVCVALDADLRWPSDRGAAVAWDWLPGDDAIVATDAGVRRVPTGAGLSCADPLRRLGSITTPTGVLPAPSPVTAAYARIACAAQLTGLARRATDVASEHAKNRVQFGSPIGAFQAVQQLLADCHVAAEAARSAVHGSAWLAWADDAAAPAAGAAAFAVCAEAAHTACIKTMQVLGGIGATWESEAHQLLRSTQLLAAAFGGLPAAYELLADELLAA